MGSPGTRTSIRATEGVIMITEWIITEDQEHTTYFLIISYRDGHVSRERLDWMGDDDISFAFAQDRANEYNREHNHAGCRASIQKEIIINYREST
jgi:hypothetical protein